LSENRNSKIALQSKASTRKQDTQTSFCCCLLDLDQMTLMYKLDP